ncbi:DeoR/GlpR family DNA-binding transcription regulator [Clostridium sp. C2-6-12]|uniref:DeoR/GlpR family DNA-binding transcription regulator n=1 Tax=Clostridium sp. C2-6-12 TaxID=2698832 RepID=UPI00136B4F30|nr:DeoR/GlpR family DNA-binding transcription regulator [Clostridium sp. C2-6-12]
MFIEERHQAILEYIEKNSRIAATEIQDMFQVSFDTARRDLRILEEKGLLKRTHGGAIPIRQIGFSKPPKITARDITEIKENYFSIAQKAVSMIKQRDVVFITSASVGYFMAQNLPKDLFITVVTNSIIIAEELRKQDNIRVIVTGGEMDSKGNFYDPFTVEAIKRMRFDKAFITSASISAEFGLSIQRTVYIEFINAIINSSKCSIGLYPTEKIGFESIISICPANKIDVLITDWDAADEELHRLEKQGIKVVVVEK